MLTGIVDEEVDVPMTRLDSGDGGEHILLVGDVAH
jgi:hypothetical protein